jgi:DNA replication protein DnaC
MSDPSLISAAVSKIVDRASSKSGRRSQGRCEVDWENRTATLTLIVTMAPEPEPVVCERCSESFPWEYRAPSIDGSYFHPGNEWSSPLRNGKCSQCQREIEETRLRKKADEYMADLQQKFLAACNVPDREMESMTLDAYTPQTKSQSVALERCKSILSASNEPYPGIPKGERIIIPDRGLYLWGSVGAGKTHLATAVIVGLCMGCRQAVRVKVPVMLQDLRATFNKEQSHGLYGRAMKSQVLLLDDIGSEKVTDWVLEKLLVLIDERLSNGRLTYLTSNLSPDDLAERISDRIVSRISGMADVIHIEGEDGRLVQHA